MKMLSIAAYNSSDDSENDSECEENDASSEKSCNKPEESVPQANSSKSGTLFASLPPPKTNSLSKINVLSEEEEEDPTFNSWNLNSNALHTNKVPGNREMDASTRLPVKITVPRLSQFQDDQPAKKKMKFSNSGSGLIGMLPSPQNTLVNKKQFIPPSVLSKPLPKRIPDSVRKYFKSVSTEEEKNEDEAVSTDFFSLTDSKATETVPEPEAQERAQDETLLQKEALSPESSYMCYSHSESLSERQSQNLDAAGLSTEEKVYVTEAPNTEIPSNFYSDEGFMRLQGKRNRKVEDVSIIDVHADQHLPDSTLYLKSISEEQPYHSHNHIPSAQHRRKHQITYLAYQAKERELELKNQWAQNRMTRYQTQAKYGF